jgi:hypothetical protein
MSTRSLLTAVATLGCALASASRLAAQTTEAQTTPEQKPGWEFLVPTGTVLPTGAQRAAVKRGNLTAAQLSYVARPAERRPATPSSTCSRTTSAPSSARPGGAGGTP